MPTLTATTNAVNHTTAAMASTINTYSDVKLFELIEANQQQQQQTQQQRQQNGIHGITITPTISTTAVPLNLLSTGCNQTNSNMTPAATTNTTTLGSVRRSARLQTRPTQLPIVTTVANETPGAIMNADQMIFFDADELQQHVLQQQQQQQHLNGNNYMHM